MRSYLVLLWVALLLSGAQAETFRFRDGSTLKCTLVAVRGDSLVLRTSFGATLAVAKDKLLAVSFAAGVPYEPTWQSAERGSLLVRLGKATFSTKATVHRGKHRREILRANAIEELLYVDGERVFAKVDSTMDKVIRKGPVREYKNTITLADIALELPAGPHRVLLQVRNLDPSQARIVDPLAEEVDFGDVVIYPGKKVELRVVVKKRMGLGRGRLELSGRRR